ncbi:hypothetical protein GCM10027360_24990 [Amycolatopsis echigonensis]
MTLSVPPINRSRTRLSRISFANWYGDFPVTSQKRCENADGLSETRYAISVTVSGSDVLSCT